MRDVLVLTKDPERSGASPVIQELRELGASFSVVDLAVPVRSVTTRAPGQSAVRQVDGSSWTIEPEMSILAWHEGRPSFASPRPAEPSHLKYVDDCQRVAWDSLLASPANWINADKHRRAVGQDKVLQARLAELSGLRAIPTVFTDSAEAYVAAIEAVPSDYVALKSPVQWHSPEAKVRPAQAVYTQRLSRSDAFDRAAMVEVAPLLVQPYIEKKFEVRAYVVGTRVLACRIDSQASIRTMIDWRHYDLANVEHIAWDLPTEVATSILSLASAASLIYAAIDLIVDPAGDYWFVELNPSGHFGWIEALTGLPIANSLAIELVSSEAAH